jgi:hypothetical protein
MMMSKITAFFGVELKTTTMTHDYFQTHILLPPFDHILLATSLRWSFSDPFHLTVKISAVIKICACMIQIFS